MLSEPAKTPAADRSGKGKRTGKRKPEPKVPKVDTDDPAWLTDTSGDLFRAPAEPAACDRRRHGRTVPAIAGPRRTARLAPIGDSHRPGHLRVVRPIR